MKWNHLDVDAEAGVKEGLPCDGCQRIVHGTVYFPKDYDIEEGQKLLRAIQAEPGRQDIDPYSLKFCAECTHGLNKTVEGVKVASNEWIN